MAKHPLRFEVWDRYKMAVLRVHNAYRPLWTALEFPGFLNYPNAVSVLRAPNLILMERMVLAVFLAAPRLGNSLWRSIAGGGGGAWQVGKSTAACKRILYRLHALKTLITKYVLLFLMGCDVRQGQWRLHLPIRGFFLGGSIDTEGDSTEYLDAI